RELIEADIRFLQGLGATVKTGLKEGIGPHIAAFFRQVAKRISDGSASLTDMTPLLEFIARSYSPAWLLLADLQVEMQGDAGLTGSANSVRRFLESRPAASEAQHAWQRLITIYRKTNDVVACCNAFLRAAEISEPPFEQLSNMGNWLNAEREVIERMDVAERG